jgi:hypothetical protein
MKPKLKKITLDPETIQRMNQIINSDYSDRSKHNRLRQIGIRPCLTCGETATYLLCYQVGDNDQKAQLVEYYCDRCINVKGLK